MHLLGVKTAVIQQRQKNPLVDAHMKRLRERWGMEIIYTRGAVRNSLEKLKQGKLVGLLADQDAGNRGVFVPFFGRPSATHVGAAVLFLKSHAPLYFAVCVRKPDGTYQLRMEKVIDSNCEEAHQMSVEQITAKFTARLEAWIRRYPEQYFWMHRRWKTAPPEKSLPSLPHSS
jgi:KDO2-lipid IV(A) lauroyltransferase